MSKDWEPKERKSFPIVLEEKGVDMEERTFKGYFAVMGNFDGEDIIEYGAFKKTLKEQGDRVKVFWIHDFRNPIGKPIELKEVSRNKLPQALLDRAPDATGALYVYGRIDPIPEGDRALIHMKSGTLDEGSIGFDTVKQSWEEDENGKQIRHIKELKLYDVSPVPLAMNPAAIITDVKSLEVNGDIFKVKETDNLIQMSFTKEEGKHEGHNIVPWEQEKPYPNEHACRLEDPGKYDTCRRGKRTADKPDSVKGKEYVVIYCKKGDGPMEQQAFRYPKDSWTAAQGRAHCEYNKGSFEAASEEDSGIGGEFCQECKVITSYAFNKQKDWTVPKAMAWLKERMKQNKEEEKVKIGSIEAAKQGEITAKIQSARIKQEIAQL